MRLLSFTEAGSLVMLWAFLSFAILDEEPMFDFSDWNLTQVALLCLGLMAFAWENLLSARSGAYVFKDAVLLYATFFFIFSVESYMQLMQVVFFCHCLSPLEMDLMDSAEVFLEFFSMASFYLSLVTLWVSLLWVMALTGSASLAAGSLALSRSCAAMVFLGIVTAWILVGWDLSINSLSLLDVGAGADLLYSHSPSAMTYNHTSNTGDQFDWHKEQVSPFMMSFEVFYLFAMQLFLFLSLGLSAWVWGFLTLDVILGQASSVVFWGLGLSALSHVMATNVVSFSLLGLPYLSALMHAPYEYAFMA